MNKNLLTKSVSKKIMDDFTKTKYESNYSICLDWLSMYFRNNGVFENSYNVDDTVVFNDDVILTCINEPTKNFNTHFVLYYKKELCAHLLMHSKNEMFFEKDVIKVEFVNHTLYSGVWQTIYDTLRSKQLLYKGCSRIDIAIDGVDYLHDLLNKYQKQTVANKWLILKNSSLKRSLFSAKVFNPKTMLSENFTIGSGKGNKMITIYNKSLEITKSGKDYIQEYWLKNGVIANKVNINEQAKKIKEIEKEEGIVTRIEGERNVYRFELRLKSESIKEIKNFSVDMLKTAQGMASIVKTHCYKYFEAVINDDINISRCSAFELLPYGLFEAKYIEKIERVEREGRYKAKLTIHGIIEDIYKGKIKNYSINEHIETIQGRTTIYNLEKYVNNKLPVWHKMYSKFVEPERESEVAEIISAIENANIEAPQVTTELYSNVDAGEISNDKDLAIRHNQAYATALFGDE